MHNLPSKTEEKGRGLVPRGRLDRAFGDYLNELNPRYNLEVQSALAESTDVRFQTFLERISDYKYRQVGLASLAKGCNIELSDFNKWWRKACSQRAIAIATVKSVKITEDIAEDAKSIKVVCARCDGLGWVSAKAGLPEDTPGYRVIGKDKDDEDAWARDCPNGCESGQIRKPGDSHSRDKILEMSGLIQKGKGIQINQNFTTVSHSSAVDSLNDILTIDSTVED